MKPKDKNKRLGHDFGARVLILASKKVIAEAKSQLDDLITRELQLAKRGLELRKIIKEEEGFLCRIKTSCAGRGKSAKPVIVATKNKPEYESAVGIRSRSQWGRTIRAFKHNFRAGGRPSILFKNSATYRAGAPARRAVRADKHERGDDEAKCVFAHVKPPRDRSEIYCNERRTGERRVEFESACR